MSLVKQRNYGCWQCRIKTIFVDKTTLCFYMLPTFLNWQDLLYFCLALYDINMIIVGICLSYVSQ